MTAAIAPGLPGLAPPATSAPPASTGQPVTGQTFADAVAAVSDAAQAMGGEPNAPPGNAPATSTNPASPADLLLLIAGILARLKSGVTGTGDGEKNDTPLPDRPAGAGVEQTDVGAMEALMGQLLLVRVNVGQPIGSDAATTVVEALASTTTNGASGDAAQLLGEITQMLQGGAPGAPASVTNAAPAVVTPVADSASTAQALPIPAAADAAQAAKPIDAAPSVAVSSASAPVVAAAAADASAAKAAADDAATAATVTGAGAPATAGVALASTDRPTESAADIRDRPAHGRPAETAPAVATAEAAKVAADDGVTRIASATRTDAAGPVTVQIANTVQSAVLRGEHEVRLVLNPPELGRVEIHITQGPDGISVQMHAEQAGARDLIQQQLPVLHQALEARDLRVDRLQVSHAEQSEAAQQSLDSRGFANQQRQQRDDAPEWSPLASFGTSALEPKRDAVRPRVTSGGGIDVMA